VSAYKLLHDVVISEKNIILRVSLKAEHS